MELTPELLLNAYANGYFPMAEHKDDPNIYWFAPEFRGVIPLEHFHIPQSLKKAMRKSPFEMRINTAFADVIRACANRSETWINDTIIDLYTTLHEMGFAHSVECWQEDKLMGGLYGVSLGGAFFGESMFSLAPNASKMALVYLVERLRTCGYALLDAQYTNAHLTQFGIEEIPQAEYLRRLQIALNVKPKPAF